MSKKILNLIYAQKEESIVHISEVSSGLKCGCICPSCGEVLIAKKGSKMQHHFAHSSGNSCEYGYETSLHLAAKEILSDAKRMVLPEVYLNFPDSYKKSELVCESEEIVIDKVLVEHRLDGIVPDVVIYLSPDGIFISNGPGDPTDVQLVIETIGTLCGKYPIFGICLGHQIISLAYGAKTYKLKFGHRGGNHPVRNVETNKIEITSQNHSYAVDTESLKETRLIPTHINILDNTIEGVECKEDHVFSVQYHPESAPGPQDSAYLFDKFIEIMQEEKSNA